MKRTNTFFNDDAYHAFTAIEKAHFLSYAPYAFQAAVLLRDYNILNHLNANQDGLSFQQLLDKQKISHYGLRILLEAGIGIGLLYEKDNRYFITKTGHFFTADAMVRINTTFMRDVCYEGAGKLKESIEQGKPMGLPYLGNWNTIYDGLSELKEDESKSWFEFDHYYSDYVFPLVMPYIFSLAPKHILDIGANTGKFSIECLKYSKDVRMHLLDLPGQLPMCDKNLKQHGFEGRYELIPHNILDTQNPIPGSYEIIWMSQFLDCFSEEQIISIFGKCKAALKPGGFILVNETFWDQQPFPAAMYSLQMTSLYFTTMANGCSQMYDSRVFNQLIEKAGLKIVNKLEKLGTTHTLLTLQ